MGSNNIFEKRTTDVLDFKFDYANTTNGGTDPDFLESGETIATHSITPETGITVDSDGITDAGTTVTVWLSGGANGRDYSISCEITTSGGRTKTDEIIVRVRDRQ